MACVYEYNGKTYDRDGFTKILLNMKPSEASKYMPNVQSVPNAPFVGSTQKWVGLALRRMVRYAAENGFDTIAWTPGSEQVTRYKEALQKAVDKIEWTKTADGVQLVGYKDGRQVVDTTEKENIISDAIGKSMGDSIIESSEQSGSFEGDDITISDTGMAGFYDKILPAEANKFFNKAKWGKAKVGKVDINTTTQAKENTLVVYRDNEHYLTMDSESHGIAYIEQAKKDFPEDKWELREVPQPVTKEIQLKVHSLPITPEMRSKALREGMPLFQTLTPEERAKRFLDEWNKDNPKKSVKIKKKDTPTFNERLKSAGILGERFDSVMSWLVDKNYPIEKVQEKLSNVKDEMNVFLKETQRPKRNAAKIEKAWDEEIKPILEGIASSKIELGDLEEYAHAKHASEANEALKLSNSKRYLDDVLNLIPKKESLSLRQEIEQSGKTPKEYNDFLNKAFREFKDNEAVKKLEGKWFEFSSKAAGMTNKDAKLIIDKWKGNEEIERLRLMLADINTRKLDLLYESGSMAKEEYDALKNKYEFYVPLNRDGFDDAVSGSGRGLSPGGKQIKTRMGSLRNVVDIVANSVANYERAIASSEKARSTRALRDLVKANPDPDFWSLNKEKKSPRLDKNGNIRMYPDLFNVDANEFRFMADGEQYLLEVNRDDPNAMRMVKLFKGDGIQLGATMEKLAKLNQYLARINTSWSPEFIISNFIRDLQTAGININDTGVDGKKMLSGAINSAKAIYNVQRGKGAETELGKMYERFKAAGGKIGWADVHGSIQKLSKKISTEIDILSGNAPLKKSFRTVFGWVEDTNTAIENGVRLHTFKLGVEQGLSDERAAQIASDLTVDFTKKGTAGPAINSLYLFANAGIQGSYRIIRAGVKSPKVRKILIGITAAGFFNGLLNSLVGEDDDEDYFNKLLDEQPYLSERNGIFMIPGTKGKHVKIPLPWGYNLFWNIGVEASRGFTSDNYKPTQGAVRLLGTLVNAFNPIASGTLLQTIAPTIADPFAMIAENKNWFGGPLMPERNIFAKVPTPDSQRYWRSARSASKYTASKLNELTGGNKIKSGAIDVSPETLDLIVDTLGGSMLRFFTDTANTTTKVIAQEKIAFHEIPFARRVAGELPEWEGQRLYYQNLEEVNTAKEQLKAYKGTDLYGQILSKTHHEQSMFSEASRSEKVLRKMRKRRKKLIAEGDKEKVEELNSKINDVHDDFNKKYRAKEITSNKKEKLIKRYISALKLGNIDEMNNIKKEVKEWNAKESSKLSISEIRIIARQQAKRSKGKK